MISRTFSRRKVRKVIKSRLREKTNLRGSELDTCTEYMDSNFERQSKVTEEEALSVFEEKFARLLNNIEMIRR